MERRMIAFEVRDPSSNLPSSRHLVALQAVGYLHDCIEMYMVANKLCKEDDVLSVHYLGKTGEFMVANEVYVESLPAERVFEFVVRIK